MYFPKSQIKTNLHTNGNLLRYEDTKVEYKGKYFKTSTGLYYSGKNPQDSPVALLELIPNNSVEYSEATDEKYLSVLPPLNDPIIDESADADEELSEDSRGLFTLPDDYLDSVGEGINFTRTPSLPRNHTPKITDQDYEFGQIQRYFLKRVNSKEFIEITEFIYNQYITKQQDVFYNLYIPFSFTWVISQDTRSKVATTNLNVLTIKQRRLGLTGLVKFFHNRYDQYYKSSTYEENLYTDGTEYIKRSTGQPYIGFYHVHPEKGAMEGAVHVRRFHSLLDPISPTSPTGSVGPSTPSAPSSPISFGGGGGGY